jgi:mRNA interferase RelE/StbE
LFQVIISRRAEKAIERLPKSYKKRILELLLVFRDNPVPAEYYDVKKLRGYRDTYRVRIGDLRIIYEVLWDAKKVHVLLIEQREKAYV